MMKARHYPGFFYSNVPFPATNRTADRFQPETPVAPAGDRFAKNIPAFDNFARPVADLTGRPAHSPAPVAPLFDPLLLLLRFMLPHSGPLRASPILICTYQLA
ncbi:hypothetical protein FIU92_08675 [Ruegeria sp. THAF33]|nr:hypothetical protein FIU92_08675 [Ruegeria sp. THAF33]